MPSRASTRLRRAGHFPYGESNQSHERPRRRPPCRSTAAALRGLPAASRRELAHPWARTCAPCSRARLRCSASSTGAEDQEQRVGTIHPWNSVSSPTALGRALDRQLFTPFGAADAGGISLQGERKGCARALHARDGDRRAPQAAADPRSGRDRRGDVSLATFFQKKVARSAVAERNQAVCRSRSQMFRCAQHDNSNIQPPQASGSCAFDGVPKGRVQAARGHGSTTSAAGSRRL